ncbi:MAG: hypothetical protein K0S23_3049 [Fluviicola sp.]|jgi:hypothetical protein|nr:hypothetical protein [Fluviicola sp.]
MTIEKTSNQSDAFDKLSLSFQFYILHFQFLLSLYLKKIAQ